MLRSTGGAVSNTGLALHRLGVPTRLMGKIGDDLFGREVMNIFGGIAPALTESMIVIPGEQTSYSVVIEPPGVDRLFLHCPGANDTFTADDLDTKRLNGAQLLHFGYPPIMREMYLDAGVGLAGMLGQVKQAGLATSLDMCTVDPDSEAGQVDWIELLKRVLPAVDFFVPSIDEITYMVDRRPPQPGATPDLATLRRVSGKLLDWGAAIVALKLGDHGLYLRTTSDIDRLDATGGDLLDRDAWLRREVYAPCFQVKVAGTTGAGDCTIAGLLAAVVRGDGPDEATRAATAVGACSVESTDACGGVRPWLEIDQRLRDGWTQRRVAVDLTGWEISANDVWLGPCE